MVKNIFIVIFSILIAIIQSSLCFDIIKINFLFVFLIYLLFFDNINSVLLAIVSGGFVLGLFSLNFGGYFFGFFIGFLILNYIYKNILSNDRLISYIILNLLGLLFFNVIFHLSNSVVKSFSGVYFFEFPLILKFFVLEFIFTTIFSLLIYYFINLFFPRTRDRLIIIGN